MTLTIGRVDPFTVGPYNIQHRGDRLRFDVDIHADTFAEAQAVRAQLLGHADNDDEPVIPITWTGDDHLDGFYQVRGVQAQPDNTYTAGGAIRCRVDLDRVVGGWSNPRFETNAISKPITDGWSLAGTLPSGDSHTTITAFTTLREQSQAGNITNVVDSADGDLYLVYDRESAGFDLSFPATLAEPSKFYWGAPKVEVDITGSGDWVIVVGRQLPDAQNYAGRWRISNGLCRVTPVFANDGELTLEVYDDGAGGWTTVATVDRYSATQSLGFATSGASGTQVWIPPQILRNSIDAVVLRFTGYADQEQTLTMRRGVSGVTHQGLLSEVRHTSEPQAGTGYTRADLGASSGTTVQAVYRSSNDNNGNRWVWATPDGSVTSDTTNGRLGATASSPLFMGVTFNNASDVYGSIGLARSAMFGTHTRTLVVAR